MLGASPNARRIMMRRTMATFASAIAAALLLGAQAAGAQSASARRPGPDNSEIPAMGPVAGTGQPTVEAEAEGHGSFTLGCDWDEIFHRSALGFGMGVGISSIAEMGGLNARLTRAGASELAAYAPYLSLSVPLSIRRFVVLTEVRLAAVSATDDTAKLQTVHATVAVGYSLTAPELLALCPLVGLGVGSATLSVGRAGPLTPSFDQALLQGSGPLELSTLAFLGTMGIDGELLIARTDDHPTRGLFAAARAGLTVNFLNSDWSLGGIGTLADGPRAPLSGFFGALALGLRL
jgi:hypothetical protein